MCAFDLKIIDKTKFFASNSLLAYSKCKPSLHNLLCKNGLHLLLLLLLLLSINCPILLFVNYVLIVY